MRKGKQAGEEEEKVGCEQGPQEGEEEQRLKRRRRRAHLIGEPGES